MTLLLRAASVVGPRSRGGRVLVQTRIPDHRVLRAATRAQPEVFTNEELALRSSAGLPPFRGLAMVRGAGADEFLKPLKDRLDVEVVGPDREGRLLVKGEDRRSVADVLSALPRPKGARVSVWVDPVRA
jgi:primosomal protein N' (replication factor Y)